ncbi:acyl-phosphate glycerol 3-phosphate acyltransferase [Candidatus Endobugula sertula]|uniref:Acyl-phosphate glycerol 3-phosphate acyltransferase n=1 Tax=Candidatus Endobugula sertula TaxID=62101 RepID=A0A1D2QRJ7_9GAMM|nr:acyl-phosphate glycerol 3-phosphate acyltransferase [Candidatus Endobugula sertula]
MLFIRSALFYLGYFISLFIIGLMSLPLLLMPKKIAAPVILLWSRFVVFWLKICCGIHYHINGNINQLPSPCVVIANHQSPWETIFLQLYLYPLTTVLKQELLHIPFFGWGLRILNPIAINRSHPVQALKQIKKISVERLQKGDRVLIFPEGTRQPVGQLGNFARSGADIAKTADVPIVVIAQDAGNYWHNKKFLKTPGTIQLTIREPFTVNAENTKEVMQDIQAWIQTTLS